MLTFDFSGADSALAYLANTLSADAVLAHPAYQLVNRHQQRFHNHTLTTADLITAFTGQPSPLYGLNQLPANLPHIHHLIAAIQAAQEDWLTLIWNALTRIFPAEALPAITIYPIIGYDMGIGLAEVEKPAGAVSLNLNTATYLAEPDEFLYYTIHECVHVVYEKTHLVHPLAQVQTPDQWLAYFALWLQNEGYAVYTPWQLRRQRNALNERDYQALSDTAQMRTNCAKFLANFAALQSKTVLNQADYLEYTFGDHRLTYRVGSWLIQQIEDQLGLAAVQSAFYLDGLTFLETYKSFLYD
jgi:hypothetical protein